MYIEQAYKGNNKWWRVLLTSLLTSGVFIANFIIYFISSKEQMQAAYDLMEDIPNNLGLIINLIPFVFLLGLLFFLVFVLVYGFISAIWETDEQKRRKISECVNKYFPNTKVYSYSSARSSIAACLGGWGIGPGDKVLISAFTCLAVPTGIIAVGAKPIYADIKPLNLNNGEDQLISLIDERVKAIIVQHTMGFGVSFSKLKEIASEKGILIIEDCALSWGAEQSGVLLGSIADAVIFSMELSKTISTGWGGILLSRNDKLSIHLNEHYEMLGSRGLKGS